MWACGDACCRRMTTVARAGRNVVTARHRLSWIDHMRAPGVALPSDAPAALTDAVTALLLDEDERVVFRVADEGDRGAAGHVERFAVHAPTQFRGERERRPQVADLHVQRHAAAHAFLQIAGVAGFGPTESGRDVHDRAVADGPVEEAAVELALPLRVARLDGPVHDGPGPVICHA